MFPHVPPLPRGARGVLPVASNQQIPMTTLFRRLQPAKKFRITISALAKHAVRLIAQLLKIPKHCIVRIECWAYVIFVHRTDKGGQFISYRRLQHWLNAVAYQIQKCSSCEQLRSLWLAIEKDSKKHKNQYNDKSQPFLRQIWTKRWDSLWNQTPAVRSSAQLDDRFISIIHS